MIARIIILLSPVYLCIGCGPAMTPRQQLMFGGLVAAQYADYETTRRNLATGQFYERNTLMGHNPDSDRITLFKAGTVALLWGLGELWPEHREFFYGIGVVSGGCAAGWNDRLYRKYK